jgi:hypothetical protein
MKVLIAGSMGDNLAPESQAAFMQACRELGVALARTGAEFVIGSSNTSTADRYVMEGAATVEEKHKVWIFRPEKGDNVELPPTDQTKTKLNPYYKRLRGPWAAGRISQVQAADAVVLIGGVRGTAQVGYTAVALNKPTLTIGSFGGAAADLWEFVEPFYARLGSSADDVGALREPWRGVESADLSVRLLREIVQRRVFSRPATIGPLLQLLFNLLLLTLWVWLFCEPPLTWDATMFGLLALSAILGSSLRSALRAVTDPNDTKSREVVVAELSAGLVLSFALAMLYLAGSFTFTGTFQPFKPDSTVDDFRRVAVGMTVIGLTGGWLLERVAERVHSWLGDRLDEESD